MRARVVACLLQLATVDLTSVATTRMVAVAAYRRLDVGVAHPFTGHGECRPWRSSAYQTCGAGRGSAATAGRPVATRPCSAGVAPTRQGNRRPPRRTPGRSLPSNALAPQAWERRPELAPLWRLDLAPSSVRSLAERARVNARTGGRQRGWVPGWSCSSRSGGIVIVRAFRSGRSRSGIGCFSRRASGFAAARRPSVRDGRCRATESAACSAPVDSPLSDRRQRSISSTVIDSSG